MMHAKRITKYTLGISTSSYSAMRVDHIQQLCDIYGSTESLENSH